MQGDRIVPVLVYTYTYTECRMLSASSSSTVYSSTAVNIDI